MRAPETRDARRVRRRRQGARQTVVTLEGWLYLGLSGLLLTGALLREINLLLVLFGLLLWPFVFNWRWVVASLRRVRVERRLPLAAHAGEPAVVSIEATNTRKRLGGWAFMVEDACRGPLAGDGLNGHGYPSSNGAASSGRKGAQRARLFFPYLAAGETRRLSYQAWFERRGRYRFGPLRVSTRFPFGFVRRSATLDGEAELVVYPRLGRLTAAWTRRSQEALAGSPQAHRVRGLQEGDYHGLRDWRPGDSKRWIHWRTSARRGELMVCQYEREQELVLAVLLDLWQPAQPRAADLEQVELAVSFAATLAADRCRQGAGQLLLATCARQPALVRGSASQALLREALLALAAAEAGPDHRLSSKVRDALAAVPLGADLVLVSTRPAGSSCGWEAALASDCAGNRRAADTIWHVHTPSGDLDRWFELEAGNHEQHHASSTDA